MLNYFRRKKRAFTLIEVLIGAAVLTILVLGVVKLLIWSTDAFKITSWKINAQQQMRAFLRKLKEDLGKATYPSLISYDGVRFTAILSGSLSDHPGASECIQYIGDGSAIDPGDPPKMGISRITFLSDDLSASTLETHGLKNAMSKFSDWDYDDRVISIGETDANKILLQFLVCTPDSTEVGDASDKGTAQLCRLLLDGYRDGKRWGLRYQRSAKVTYEVTTGNVSGSLTTPEYDKRVIDDVVRVDIAHELLPNDPPIGDYDPGTGNFQYLKPVTAGGSQMQTVAKQSLIRHEVDMRRCSLITIMFMLREAYEKNEEGYSLKDRGLTIAEPLEVKTSVHVVDKLTY